MLGAGAARFDEALFQGGARTKDAHARIARRQTALLGEYVDRRAIDVDGLQGFCVLGLQGAGEAPHAGADFRLHVGLRRRMRLQLARKSLDRPIRYAAPAKLVDGGIAERSIEPRHNAFVGRGLLGAVDDLGECVLQDIFGERSIADAPFQILQECPVVLEKDGQRCWSVVVQGFGVSHC